MKPHQEYPSEWLSSVMSKFTRRLVAGLPDACCIDRKASFLSGVPKRHTYRMEQRTRHDEPEEQNLRTTQQVAGVHHSAY